MKIFLTTILFSISISVLLTGQSEVGHFINADDVKTPIYENPKDEGVSFNKIGAGSDCKFENGKFYYFNKEGKVNNEKQSKIKFLTINAESMICQAFKPQSVGSDTPYKEEDIRFILKHPATYLGLPFKKNSRTTVLQSVLVKNDKYMLTTYTPDSGEAWTYIYTNESHQYVKGNQRTNAIGFTKKGKEFYSAIKNHFKNCPDFIDKLKENEAYNSKVKALKKIPLLSEVAGISCQ